MDLAFGDRRGLQRIARRLGSTASGTDSRGHARGAGVVCGHLPGAGHTADGRNRALVAGTGSSAVAATCAGGGVGAYRPGGHGRRCRRTPRYRKPGDGPLCSCGWSRGARAYMVGHRTAPGAIDDWLTGGRNRLLIRVFPHRVAGACRSHDGPQTDPVSPCRVRNRLLLSDAILDEIVDNCRIGKCRGIPQGIRFVGCDLAQDAAHDLAGARLR